MNKMALLRILADPGLVARFQCFCGVEYEKPATCDQQTQTRRESSDSESGCENDDRQCHDNIDSPINCPKYSNNRENKEYSDAFQKRHRIISGSNVEEYNNTCTDLGFSNMDLDLSEKAKYKANGFNHANGYSSVKSNSKSYARNIYECSECSGDVNLTKSTNDNSMPKITGVSAQPTGPAVRIKYKSLLYLAYFGAFLGNEEFYLTFFPFGVWNFDSLLFRQVAMLWCVVMYLGQATKDYLRWPRPPCPPVVRLETHYSQEYSMPSTHAMAGTAIPICLAYFLVERYQVSVYIAGIISLLWFTVTCWSRLYLGVHTILDLIAGFLYAILIFLSFLGYVEGYDMYQQTHPFAAPVLLFTALALCTVCYPSSYKDSSKGDAVQIVAALTGVGIGSWLGYQLGYFHESDVLQPYSITVPTLSWCGLALMRLVTGAAVLAVLYVVTRWSSIRFYSYMYGLDGPDKTFPGVMTAYKFTTYTVVGTGISLFVPLVHLYLGIHRPAVFKEVF